MTFTHPWVLLFLAIPVVLLWTILARPAGVTAPADGLPVRSERRAIRAFLGFFEVVPLLLLAIVITMLAGQQTLQQPKRERSLTNITICLDVSGSMSGRNYQLATKAVEDFT
ncbi:MAG: aerotolerance regulator BatA, partial [bacterium]